MSPAPALAKPPATSHAHFGRGVAAIAAGLAVARGGGLVATNYEYCLAVIALAAVATLNLSRLPSHDQTSSAETSR